MLIPYIPVAVPRHKLELPVKLKSKKRGTRRDQTSAKIAHRILSVQAIDPALHSYIKTKCNRWNKRHPFDCGQTRCFCCHGDKLSGDKPVSYRRRYGI